MEIKTIGLEGTEPYSPFAYIETEEDVRTVSKALESSFQDTKEPKKRAKALEFLVAYMYVFIPVEKQSLSTLQLLVKYVVTDCVVPYWELRKMVLFGERLLKPSVEEEKRLIYVANLLDGMSEVPCETFLDIKYNLWGLNNQYPPDFFDLTIELLKRGQDDV